MNVSITDPRDAKTFPNLTEHCFSDEPINTSSEINSAIFLVLPKIDTGLAALSVEMFIKLWTPNSRHSSATLSVPMMFVKKPSRGNFSKTVKCFSAAA
jgi:hypothetical protein